MIEDAKSVLRTWGAADPNFLLCNSKLTFQMTMNPEKTQYLTQGPDGVRRLKDGPNINTYRGLRIINSRSFSMEDGAPPRDVLRRYATLIDNDLCHVKHTAIQTRCCTIAKITC